MIPVITTAAPSAQKAPLTAPDIASSGFKADPHPFYACLREEAPVFHVRLSRTRQGWLLTRYEDVFEALRDRRLGKDKRSGDKSARRAHIPWVTSFLAPLERNMLDLDPPDHTRLRGLVHKAFTPRLIERLRARIQSLTDEYLDRVAARREIELVADYALPLPATIIAEMLGVPAEDRHRFHAWSSKIVTVTGATDLLTALPSVISFMRYLRSFIEERRSAPRDDLISALVQAEEAGDTLTADEILGMVFLLLVAGHETTVNLISGGALALLQHPEQLDLLKREPAHMETAVEELLRYVSPVEIATERYAREEVTYSGTTIPRGALVLTVLGSANRDHRQFVDPDTLDLTRAPNRHVAFGQGVHYCLGAPLARLEAQIAFETLLRRCPDLKLAVSPERLQWRHGLFLRGLKRLPLTF